jgi:hypothetical protein
MDQNLFLTVSGLRLFENEMLRRMYGHRRVEIYRKRRLEKLHKEERHSLYSLFNMELIKSRRLKCVIDTYNTKRNRGNRHKILVGKPQRDKQLYVNRRNSENCIKGDLRGIGYKDVKCIQLAQDMV